MVKVKITISIGKLGHSEHHIDTDLVLPSNTNVMKDFDFRPPIIVFFYHLFPSIKGHAIVIDKYLSRASHHETMKRNKIQFHDPMGKDPDCWKAKNYYLLLIATTTEVENGIENLLMQGRVGNWGFYPDFGKFISVNEMKCFYSAAPYCWCDEQYWFLPDRGTP
jgi:hypothetical protein